LALDTLLIGAPSDIREPSADVVDLLQRSYQRTRRIASICVQFVHRVLREFAEAGNQPTIVAA